MEVLNAEGILPGIKVDQGLVDFGSEGEKLTKGLDGLAERLAEYVTLGAKFCKWRSVITISNTTSPSLPSSNFAKASSDLKAGVESAILPTDANIRQNAKDLAAYALECQKAGLVPMVEPEVLIEGDHTIAQAESASEKVLTALFEELAIVGVALEGTILKTSMVISGKGTGVLDAPSAVAEATLRVFAKVLPKNLAGQAFLSGGQSELQATANLNAINQSRTPVYGTAINQTKNLAWPLTFSFARALQDGATKAWGGKAENLNAAQKTFLHRAKMNSLASIGQYSEELEKGFTLGRGGEASQD